MDAPKITVEDLTSVRKRLSVEIPAAVVQRELDEHFENLGRRSRLRGFRPGKAPRAVLEKMFGDQVRREVVAHLVEETFYPAVESQRLAVVGTPDIQAEDLVPGSPLTYAATVDVRPEIQLGDLSQLEAQRPVPVVDDEQVEQVLRSMREAAARLRPIEDRAVLEAGDVVTVDLATTFDGGKPVRREGVMLEAGGGTFPLAIERQIVGQHRGAHLALDVPYPDDYANPQLAGKTAHFELDLRDLHAKDLPPLDDDFARDHGQAESLVDLRAKIRTDLEARAAHQADVAVRHALLEQIVSRHPFDVPASLVERRCEAMLMSLGVRVPEGAAGEEALGRLREELRPRAEQDVRAELILEAIAAREGLAVADDEVSAEIDAIAQREQQAPERLRALYDRPEARAALRARLLRERALERVVTAARIVPAETRAEVARG